MLSEDLLRNLYLKMSDFDNSFDLFDEKYDTTTKKITEDQRKINNAQRSVSDVNVVSEFCLQKCSHIRLAEHLNMEASTVLRNLLDHVWMVGNSLESEFSFIPLMTELHLRINDINLLRQELLSMSTNINLLELFANTMMSPSELMLLVSILYTEIKSMPVYYQLMNNAKQLEYRDLINRTTEDDVRRIFEDELEACTSTLRRCTAVENGISSTKIAQLWSTSSRVVNELYSAKDRAISGKCDRLHNTFTKDELSVKLSNFAQQLPVKYAKRATELATIGGDDDEIQICSTAVTTNERSQTMATPIVRLLPWPPDYLPPAITVNRQYYARINTTVNTPFSIVTLVKDSRDETDCVEVNFEGSNYEITRDDIAYVEKLCFFLDEGMRIIARYQHRLSCDIDTGWYSATVAMKPSSLTRNEYLVFFDTDCAQYVSIDDVRMLCNQQINMETKMIDSRSGWRHAPIKMQNFLKKYLDRYPDWPLVRMHSRRKGVAERIGVERNGVYVSAIVLDIDRHLALLRFPDTNSKDVCTEMNCTMHQHFDEWIYRGSLRFRALNDEFGQSVDQQASISVDNTRTSTFASASIVEPTTMTSAIISKRSIRRRFHRRQFEYMSSIDSSNLTHDIVTIDDDDEDIDDGNTIVNTAIRRTHRMQTARKSTTTPLWTVANAITNDEPPVEQQLNDRALELARQRQNQFQLVYESIDYVELNWREHANCSDQCIVGGRDAELNEDRFKLCSPFIVPLKVGWKRQIATKRVRRKMKKSVYYVAPCGRRLRSIAEIALFLKCSHSKLTIDLFTFDPLVRPVVKAAAIGQLVMEDYSHGFENIPISVVNAVDDQPVQVIDYVAERFPAVGVNLRTSADDGFCSGCSCTDDCSDSANCECQQLTRDSINRMSESLRPSGRGYKYRRLVPTQTIMSGIFECNSKCLCSKQRCYNRVAQQPMHIPIQLFKTAEKGWGIRSLVDLPVGTFVCSYVGEILTDVMADLQGRQGGDEYYADLDLISNVLEEKERQGIDLIQDVGYFDGTTGGDENVASKSPSVDSANDDNDDNESRDSDYQSTPSIVDDDEDNDDVGTASAAVRIKRQSSSTNCIREQLSAMATASSLRFQSTSTIVKNVNVSTAAVNPVSSNRMPANAVTFDVFDYFGEEHSMFIVNARTKGNIGRFLNHSCNPNIIVQPVFVDTHDLRLHWVALFTKQRVLAGEEICWDYSYEVGSVPGRVINCKCKQKTCRKRIL